MVSVADLWLPTLLSGVFVFVVSSIIHMCLPAIHKKDWAKLPGEEAIRAAMRSQGIAPGSYMFPHAESMKLACAPEHLAKLSEGPVGMLTVIPNGPPKMGKCLLQWFLYCVIVSLFAGYLTGLSTGPGAEYMQVFRRAGTAAILGFAVSSIPDSIWKGVSWKITGKFIFDGILYGLTAAGTFAWLWPEATAG